MTLPLFTVHHLHGKAPRTADQPGVFREMEFHVSRKARDRYQFDLSLFTTNGRVIFANPYAARLFSQKINDARDLISQPDSAASAADITAMGLIDEILHSVIARYRQEVNPRVFQEAITYLQQEISLPELETTLQQFVNDFPPLQVYTGQKTVLQYLAGSSNGVSHREMALEEMLLLWFSNNNPAFAKYRELFDDQELRQNTAYPRIMTGMRSFFDTQPPLPGLAGPGNLIDFLSLPFLSVPGSLVDQLRFIRENWGTYLRPELGISWEALLSSDFMERWGVPNPDFETRTLRSIDFYEEEHKMRFNPGMGPAPTEVPFFGYVHHEEEPEQFSEDLHWMPQLVLVAKSTLVWLDQLSKTYGKEIRQLDQIPIEEIKELAARGFTGIWLIGIWQRSKASRKLKQWCGNPEAESSAYSLYEYRIAEELGGDEAYAVFKERCASVGVRVGSDMVPNHTGIESRWMEEHPDWFVQSPYPPFPSYKFDSGNLSEHPHVAIHLEDHYYNRTDASVVFKRVDKRTGDVRYVYHGNDGTSMPWNDTAQLNYLLPQVREAVIQTIIRVAKQFPIIRFDAAMTLAKKHYHRLWFPQPGSGGDIPSRAEHGLTREQFDQLMPVEFWREVVDRIAEEAPDTLLLAEAFWLMEGYFVRTLGMHRVYNSAFMHMLKNEENQKYRYTIKNTIEFEPEILKRYVNFMNNPDEETAINQFGDGDKYFGVCVMMSTMPGLPMFGHGQVEGFHEKYGMEYRRAYYDEQPSAYLIERHRREVFPLLKKRYLFAEVDKFLLYDFFNTDGSVNENVFAFSNRFKNERALVVFHNAYDDARGWIRTSAAFTEKDARSGERRLVQKAIGEGLALDPSPQAFSIMRDHVTGLEYLYHNQTLMHRGMYMELGAYKYHVFIDFRQVSDHDGHYARLNAYLNGRGVPSVEESLREMHLQPLHQAFRVIFNVRSLKHLAGMETAEEIDADALRKEYVNFLEVVQTHDGIKIREELLAREATDLLEDAQALQPQSLSEIEGFDEHLKGLYPETEKSARDIRLALVTHALLRPLSRLFSGKNGQDPASLDFIDSWMLGRLVLGIYKDLGMRPGEAEELWASVRLILLYGDWHADRKPVRSRPERILEHLLGQPAFQHYVQVNRYEEVLWFNKERFESALRWLLLTSALANATFTEAGEDALSKDIALLGRWQKALGKSEYQVVKLLEALKPAKAAPKKADKTTTKKEPVKKTAAKKTKPAENSGTGSAKRGKVDKTAIPTNRKSRNQKTSENKK